MDKQPPISVVIIGINVAQHLGSCIQALLQSRYPQKQLEIIYADGGSNDDSLAIAKSYPGIRTLNLELEHPTPGQGRNAGARETSHEIIQFLDGDTLVDPDWLSHGVQALQENAKVAAVCGQLREVHPERNAFHQIADIEWGHSTGEVPAFGGNVLMKKSALIGAGGYDSELIAGEDPELSYRLRSQGYTLLRLPVVMGLHDIQMDNVRSYLRRSFRTGHAYAELATRYLNRKEKFWFKDLLRIKLSVILPWLSLLLGIVLGFPLAGGLFALTLAFRQLRHVRRYQKEFSLSLPYALAYAFHLALVVYPQFLGALRYFYTLISKQPLRNKSRLKAKKL